MSSKDSDVLAKTYKPASENIPAGGPAFSADARERMIAFASSALFEFNVVEASSRNGENCALKQVAIPVLPEHGNLPS